MKTTRLALLLAAFALTAGTAGAQEIAPGESAGSVDFGVRLYDNNNDAAYDQRYRDLRTGPDVDRFRYTRDQGHWVVNAEADHVGYRDQRYFANFERPGRVKASFTWNQVPLYNSAITLTPLVQPSPAVFRLDDAIQGGIQAGTMTLANAAAIAQPLDLRSKREIAAFALVLTAAPQLDVKFNLTSTARKGAQPWGVGFGFSNVVEVAAPLDHRTTDVGTSAEWANDKAMVRIGYDGSWFQNNVDTLIVDNPVRLTDAVGQVGQSRMAMWPDSTAQYVNTAGSIKLPGRSRATALISVGNWTQDADLIPFTINTALPVLTLDRPTADISARITAMNYTFTSSPGAHVWFNARYKRYDFDNRTAVFDFPSYVRTDQSVVVSAIGETEPLSYTRDNFDADASFTPIPFTALRIGYGREEVSRVHRYYEVTTDNVLRTSVDMTGNQWFNVRGIYEYSRRVGNGLDEEVLDQVGEQVTLRQFDMSDRDRHRVSAIFQVTPVQSLGITASIATGSDHRPDAEFGVQDLKGRSYAISVDAVPSEGTSFGASYGYEKYNTLQNSRQATAAQFEDPTRNWSTDAFERVHTANISADLLNLAPKLEFRFSYDLSYSKGRYDYLVPANSTLPPVSQLPTLYNERSHGAADARYRIRPDMSLGIVYWLDHYRVDDFALDENTLTKTNMTTGVLLLRNAYQNYTSNTVMLRVIYLW